MAEKRILIRDRPIFTTQAHLFQIDPETKKKWLPLSSRAIDVSFYHDSTKNKYRIISIEDLKPIVDSTVTPKMNFSKTSQKFGQWADSAAATVYGLGFSSESELTKFSDKFSAVKELLKVAAAAPPPATNIGRTQVYQNGNTTDAQFAAEKERLQTENERLKKSLAESSSNAAKWELELKSLRRENDELKAVMMENQKNVAEWMKRLEAYETERTTLSARIAELQKNNDTSVLQRQLSETMNKLQVSERSTQQKQDEVMQMKRKLEEFERLEGQNKTMNTRLQRAEEDKQKLEVQLQTLQQQLSARGSGSEQLQNIQKEISNKINDLYEMNDKLAEIIQATI